MLGFLERQAAQRFLKVPAATQMTAAKLQDTIDEEELELSLSQGGLWIARWNGVPAGFVATHLYPKMLYVREIDVLAEFGRRGIGKALISQAIEHARHLKLESVFLRTFREVAWNAPFYQRLGFQEVEERTWNHVMHTIVDVETCGWEVAFGVF
jgi:N-acetylglutamate synthase-like GNAT family acetyltransferase